MELELATTNQIVYELVKRDKPFILLLPPSKVEDEPEPKDATLMHCCGQGPGDVFQELAGAAEIVGRVLKGEDLPENIKIIPMEEAAEYFDLDPTDDPWNEGN